MRAYAVVLLSACFAATLVSGQVGNVPILSRYPGLVYNNASESAKVVVEAFYDLNCPDSAASFPVLKQVGDHYGPTNIQVRFHQFPLPYHRNALLCNQGLLVIRDQVPSKTLQYMQAIFNNLDQLVDSATADKTETQIVDLIADFAVSATGIDKQTFIDYIYLFRGTAAVQWKFACRRGVAGTPWFFVNGIDLSVNPSARLSFDDWKNILDPLMDTAQSPSSQFRASHTVLKSKYFH